MERKSRNWVFSKVLLGFHSYSLITSELLITVLKGSMSATWRCLHLAFTEVQEFKHKHKQMYRPGPELWEAIRLLAEAPRILRRF